MYLHTVLSGIEDYSACYVTSETLYILSFVALHKKYPVQTVARSLTPLTDLLHTIIPFLLLNP